jgi:endo-1,4-beta-xylanase
MKKLYLRIIAWGALLVFVSVPSRVSAQTKTLKEAFAGKFYIGTAMNAAQIEEKDTVAVRLIKSQFSAIVPENCTKSGPIQPMEGKFDFSLADKFVDFGVKNKLFITGHTLVWHSQAPRWFFTDSMGKDVSREVLIERMKKHIYTVVGRYKGKIKGWDVVNEAIDDKDGTLRKSKFYQIIGEDYIKLAFQFAHEADPQAELYYNDYSLFSPVKRKGALAMIKKLKEQGVKIDAVGEQCHIGLDFPTIEEYEQTILDFASLGVKVMITEMDISVLNIDRKLGADVSGHINDQNNSNPYVSGLPDSVNIVFEKRYLDFFRLFLKYRNVITRVTLWGVNDTQSWKNNWPVWGRTDYPLLFDRKYQPKPVVGRIINEASGNLK